MQYVRSGEKTRTPHIGFSVLFPLAVAALVALFAVVGASANPSIQEKQAQAQAIMEQVQLLDAEVGDAAERWNGANYELGRISTELASARADLARARVGVRVSQARAGARLRQLYVNGEPASAVEVLLGAKSLNEILDMLDATERITSQDAEIVGDLKRFRERAILRREQVARARAEQVAVVRQRAAEKAAIEARLAERQRLLASVKDEIVRLEEAERRRQAELRRQAQLELERQQAAAAAAAAARRQAEQQAQTELAATEAPAPASDGESAAVDASSSAAPAPIAPPADAGKGAQVVAIAMQYLGIPYVWGGASPSAGFDCSGLTMYVFNQVGVSLPHYAAAQYGMGVAVSKDQLQPGDLVFFRGLGHMGMYIGGGSFIHAPHTGDVVKISPLSDPYYVANWVGARRVL